MVPATGTPPRVEVYGTEFCSYCAAARLLLKRKGVAYEDIVVSGNREAREEMERRSGRRTVPQIFIDGRPIGGFDELNALERSGELDRLLGGPHDP
jgi:glutaredoxin 3